MKYKVCRICGCDKSYNTYKRCSGCAYVLNLFLSYVPRDDIEKSLSLGGYPRVKKRRLTVIKWNKIFKKYFKDNYK